MPTKPQSVNGGASFISGQAATRYVATFRDQHALSSHPRFKDGRPWWGWREMAANRGDIDGFCSPLWPGDHEAVVKEQWEAPWMPEAPWMEFHWRKQTIRIRYDKVISHFGAMGELYYRRVNRMCNRNGWPMVERGELPPDAVTDIHGDPPLSTRIFQACQASHPWMLGFSDEPDEELARLMSLTIPGAGIYHPPRKVGLVPVETTTGLSDEALDARIAAAVAVALAKHDEERRLKHSEAIKAGRARGKQTAGAGAS